MFGSVASSFEPLPDVVSTLQEMFPNLSKTQTLAVETNWRKFAHLFKSQKQQVTSLIKMCLLPLSVRKLICNENVLLLFVIT